jgi:hypothetical protein
LSFGITLISEIAMCVFLLALFLRCSGVSILFSFCLCLKIYNIPIKKGSQLKLPLFLLLLCYNFAMRTFAVPCEGLAIREKAP